jgi:hypothetical protein
VAGAGVAGAVGDDRVVLPDAEASPAEPAAFVDSLSGPGTLGGAQPDTPEEPPKSKTGMWIGIAAVVALIALVGGILIATSGGGGDDVATADESGDKPSVRTEEKDDDEKKDDTKETTTSAPTSTSTTVAPTSTTAAPISSIPGPSPTAPPQTQGPVVTLPPDTGTTPTGGTPSIVLYQAPAGEIVCATGTTMVIGNNGTGIGSYSVQVSQLSVTGAPLSGALSPGQSVTLTIKGVGCPRDYDGGRITVNPIGTFPIDVL